MSTQDNGGPAFPMLPPLGPDGTAAVGYPYVSEGMTLRDYFVAKAMQGLLAHPECQAVGPGCASTTQRVVLEAYAMADAMLAERAK